MAVVEERLFTARGRFDCCAEIDHVRASLPAAFAMFNTAVALPSVEAAMDNPLGVTLIAGSCDPSGKTEANVTV
ncbi:MAG: hypothetical protein K8F35_14735 [Dokdonella sp.]|uniref:hypothetical protein n=1 Tax=Dokdonella sp. TaxID=2291710 RepID=UPI0025C0DBA4|nr:hypothetical protein [Dokdonella sp.]MBZ0224269.1 hypothetical protein [Dokdonella sp.]